MRKFYAIGAALLAVFAVGVLTAASASAAVSFLLAEWLAGGSPVTTSLASDTEGELLLEETIIGVKIDALCSGIFVGTVGNDGEDTITELLNLGKELIDLTPLTEPGLICTNTTNCPEPLAWADNLPWSTLLELMVDGTEEFFVDLLTNSGAGNPGYHVVCMGVSGLEDLCTSEPGISKITNTTEGLNGEFSELFNELAEVKLGNCVTAGNEKGVVEGLGFILLTETGAPALTASE